MLKNIFYSVILFLALLLAGCSQTSNSSENPTQHTAAMNSSHPTDDDQSSTIKEESEPQEGHLYGVITAIDDQQVAVSGIGLNGEGDLKLSQKELEQAPSEYEIGDVLLVRFSGSISETYPASYGDVQSVVRLTQEEIAQAQKEQWTAPKIKNTAGAYVVVLTPRKDTGLRVGEISLQQGGPNGNIQINTSDFGNSLAEYQVGDLIQFDYRGSESSPGSRNIGQATAIQKI